METVKAITNKFEDYPIDKIAYLIDKYADDERKQIIKLRERFSKKYDKHLMEIKRLCNMYIYENEYYNKGIYTIMGIDEAGRGPLCGPVVVAGVILPPNLLIKGLNDSKKINEEKRILLFNEIMEKAICVCIEKASHTEIDSLNINGAIYKCINNILENADIPPDTLLIDGNYSFKFNIKHENIIEGDLKSASIAAASIIAKVTRDMLMNKYDNEYPIYGFSKNKGYGTKEHIEAIKKYGICPIHRKTFVKNFYCTTN